MAAHQDDSLAAMNSATLGANMPVITLASGKKVQTGTIGALLANIREYDELLLKVDRSAGVADPKINELEDRFRAAIPLLRDVGFFDVFAPEEWISGSKSAGRTRVGELVSEVEGTKES